MSTQEYESPLSDETWSLSDEESLALFLEVAREQFASDRTNPLPAFKAIGFVTSYYWQQGTSPETIEIPLWAAETICSGFMQYWDEAKGAAPRQSFGEALGLEGGGQGRRPKILAYLKSWNDIQICLAIAFKDESGIKIEAAIQEIAGKRGLSYTTVRDIWSRHAEHARNALRNFRTRHPAKTS